MSTHGPGTEGRCPDPGLFSSYKDSQFSHALLGPGTQMISQGQRDRVARRFPQTGRWSIGSHKAMECKISMMPSVEANGWAVREVYYITGLKRVAYIM